MKIRYIWCTEPTRTRRYDTEVAYKKLPQPNSLTLEEWNELELQSFEENKLRGLVVNYWLEEQK